jgi:hypothetical protein
VYCWLTRYTARVGTGWNDNHARIQFNFSSNDQKKEKKTIEEKKKMMDRGLTFKFVTFQHTQAEQHRFLRLLGGIHHIYIYK